MASGKKHGLTHAHTATLPYTHAHTKVNSRNLAHVWFKNYRIKEKLSNEDPEKRIFFIIDMLTEMIIGQSEPEVYSE